jgi:hypothetical protein
MGGIDHPRRDPASAKMTTISEQEQRHRRAAIARGPWAKRVAEAGRELAPDDDLSVPKAGSGSVMLHEIRLSDRNKRKNQRLERILRPHFKSRDGITSESEIKIREDLDLALMSLQLYELAVQTGYLTVDSVRRPARKILIELCWSSAARNFVAAYDYLGVSMLAARLGIQGIGRARPPEPDSSAAFRFAGFLAHLRSFYGDELIQTWTGFLDDHIEEKNEQDKIWEYLQGAREAAPKRSAELLAGCQLFVGSMATAFEALEDEDLGRFGLIHAYWLAKFFGYELDDGGYSKNVDLWDSTDSWGRTVANSPHLVGAGIDREMSTLLRRQFSERVHVLSRTFNAVRQMVKSAGVWLNYQ